MVKRSFFKFRSIDSILGTDEKQKQKEPELEGQYLWFSDVEGFNDPCELICKPFFYTNNFEDWINYIFRPFLGKVFRKELEKTEKEKNIDFYSYLGEYPIEKCLTSGLEVFSKGLCNQKVSVYTVFHILDIVRENVINNVCSTYNNGESKFSEYDFSAVSKKENFEEITAGWPQKSKIEMNEYLIECANRQIFFESKYDVSSSVSLSPFLDYGKEFIYSYRKDYGITCFCETYSKIRMWNEYT